MAISKVKPNMHGDTSRWTTRDDAKRSANKIRRAVDKAATTESNELPRADFFITVMGRIVDQYPAIDVGDLSHVGRCIEQTHNEGFSVEDSVAYCKCLEEVNPTLDEDIALARMDRIRSKYIQKQKDT